MPVYLLDERLAFPDPSHADPESGILAVGGDLSPERLLLAYSLGIFPWYDETLTPILWHSPEERFAMRPSELRLGRSLRRDISRSEFDLTFDRAFEEVIDRCAHVPRDNQSGTWLNDDMSDAYIALHRAGHAHSAEAWLNGQLVGGLYGVTLGGVFFGESMFSLIPNASKVVFASLLPRLAQSGYRLVDCQVYTEYLARFGAHEWSRDAFLDSLKSDLLIQPCPRWPESFGDA